MFYSLLRPLDLCTFLQQLFLERLKGRFIRPAVRGTPVLRRSTPENNSIKAFLVRSNLLMHAG